MKEVALYEQVQRYLNTQYPRVISHWDLSGVHNPSPVTRALYSRLNGRAFPDLMIAVPRVLPDGTQVGALFLELKVDGTRLRTKTGKWASRHIEEQAAVLELLAEAGYTAQFACGFEQTKELIDSYLVPSWEPPTTHLFPAVFRTRDGEVF